MKKSKEGKIEIIFSDSGLGSAFDDEVRSKLRKDQEKRKFKDHGRYVAGSRKEKAALRRLLDAGDLETIEKDEASAIDLVVKENVWERFDVAKLQDQGITAGAAFLMSELRKAFPPKPISNTKDQRKAYVNFANYVQNQIANCINFEDLAKLKILYTNFNDTRLGFINSFNSIRLLFTGEEYLEYLDNLYSFKKKYPKYYSELLEAEAYESDSLINDMHTESNNLFYLFSNNALFKVLKYKLSSRFANLLLNQSKASNKTWRKAKELEEKQDWSWSDKKSVTNTKSDKLTINSGVKLSYIKRRGGYYIPEKIINEKGIIDKLGYSGIQLGKSIPDDEIKEHIRHFVGAMSDLHQALNWDVAEVNRSGELAIAFAARGKGRAMAHYEPLRRIINLTRKSGDGSVSHEWFHFLDHFVNIRETGVESGNTVLYSSQLNQKTGVYTVLSETNPIKKAYLNIISFYVTNEYVKDGEIISGRTGKFKKKFKAYPGLYRMDYGNSPEQALRILKQNNNAYLKYPSVLKSAAKVIGSIAHKYELPEIEVELECRRVTQWYSQCVNYGKYWHSTVEMLARGFEVYIYNKLRDMGIENNYLVSNDNFNHSSGVYPQELEADIITNLYDDLMFAIKDKYQIPDFIPFSDKKVNSFIRLDGQGHTKSGKIFVENKPNADSLKLKLKLQKAKLNLLNI